VAAKLPPEAKEELTKYAKEHKTTPSRLAREFITSGLAEAKRRELSAKSPFIKSFEENVQRDVMNTSLQSILNDSMRNLQSDDPAFGLGKEFEKTKSLFKSKRPVGRPKSIKKPKTRY